MVSPRLFGTDGIRGVVGETLTPELVGRVGKAAALWSKGGRVLIARDTRASGVELEAMFALGVRAGGGKAVLAGILPTPAVGLFALDLGVVITASHNPSRYNGIKFFDRWGGRLSLQDEAKIESLLDAPAPGGGDIEATALSGEDYGELIVDRFGCDLEGLKIALDCAQGAYSQIAPKIFEQLGADVYATCCNPTGENINEDCGTGDLGQLTQAVIEQGCDLGFAFDGDGDRLLAVDHEGNLVDGDHLLSIVALDQGATCVVVTQMTSLAFHKLMREHGIPVYVSDVGDRALIKMMNGQEARLGGGHPGHIVDLHRHVTSDGLSAALAVCQALKGRTLAEAARSMPHYIQIEGVVPASEPLPLPVAAEIGALNRYLRNDTRVLARSSGTEPVIRLLAEAPTRSAAEGLYARLEAMVFSGLKG